MPATLSIADAGKFSCANPFVAFVTVNRSWKILDSFVVASTTLNVTVKLVKSTAFLSLSFNANLTVLSIP